MKKLEGKVALVTGGSKGIGAATVKRFAEEGANVAFTYSNSKDEADKLVAMLRGAKVKAYKADAAQPENMLTLAKEVLKDFGKVDILVNNAGVFGMGNIGEESLAEYEKMMNINVKSVYILTNELVKTMQKGSRIINISSCLGERASGAMMSTYAATKFAVAGFSRGWAKDLGAKGILSNAIMPGPIATDMNPEDSDFADHMRAQTALGRYGRAEEVAAAALFLAGPDSTYITGSTIAVDGGWNA